LAYQVSPSLSLAFFASSFLYPSLSLSIARTIYLQGISVQIKIKSCSILILHDIVLPYLNDKVSEMELATKKGLSYFNANKAKGMEFEPSFNEDYNKSKGIPSRSEWAYLSKVAIHFYGIFGYRNKRLTSKMVEDFEAIYI
jgi:hypothetical protein